MDRSNTTRVRPMTMGDSETVAGLSGQLGYPSTRAEIERRYRALDGNPDSQVLIAEGRDGAVLGWLHVFGNHLLESEGEAEVGGLVVDSRARGQGIGKRLMDAAEAWARGHGYTKVCVRSNTIRLETHRFYQRLGYNIMKSQYKFLKPLREP